MYVYLGMFLVIFAGVYLVIRLARSRSAPGSAEGKGAKRLQEWRQSHRRKMNAAKKPVSQKSRNDSSDKNMKMTTGRGVSETVVMQKPWGW